MKNRRESLPIFLAKDEALKLLDQPSKSCRSGRRNYAIIYLMLSVGLRVSEITKLCDTDVDLEHQILHIRFAKGRKDRNIHITKKVYAVLFAWDQERPHSNYFFPTLRGSQLSTRYLQQAIPRYATAAGIEKRVTPHTMRHTFATQFILDGGNVILLKQILGHKSVSTTMIYVTLTGKDEADALDRFSGF